MKRRRTRPLNEKRFWSIVQKSKSILARTPAQHQERLIRILVKLPVNDIIIFDRMFHHFMNLSNTWDIRAAVHIIKGNSDEETFTDFRGWLVTRGKVAYYKVLKDPEHLGSLIKIGDPCEWDGYDFCAEEAYERKTGSKLRPVTATNGQKWEESDLPAMFPKLWKKYVVIE